MKFKTSSFNTINTIVNQSAGQQVSFKYVIDRYSVTKEQLKNDMKNLRWENKGGVIYFDLKQIRDRYVVDSYKLETVCKLDVVMKDRLEAAKVAVNRRL
jgi:hypothetical protein